MKNGLELVMPTALREKVFAIENVMLAHPEAYRSGGTRNIDDLCPVKHHFAKGVYAREMFIPKGTVLVGKIHKHTNLNIMSAGELSVLTDEGIKRVKAPFTVISPPGVKRIAYAHEDTVWTTVHGTEETDIEKIEQQFIAQSEQEFLEFCEQQQRIEDKPMKQGAA